MTTIEQWRRVHSLRPESCQILRQEYTGDDPAITMILTWPDSRKGYLSLNESEVSDLYHAYFLAWGIAIIRSIGCYIHFNQKAIVVGSKHPFFRKSFSYDKDGNIAGALMLALLAALEAAPTVGGINQ
jgi:hypothetical protein